MDHDSTDEALTGYRQIFRLPGVRALLVSACLSRLASHMLMLAIVLYVLDRFHSPVLAGWITFAAIAPGLAVSPLAGAWLDRMGPARGIVVDMAASALLIFVLAIAGLADILSMPLLVVLVTFFSLTTPLGSAGIRALLPQLVSPDALDRANALDTTSYAIIDILGPAVAGVLFGFAGPHAVMITIAALYMMSGACLAGLARRPVAAWVVEPGPVVREAIAGVAYVLRNPSLRGLAVSYALYQISFGILFVAVPVIVLKMGSGDSQSMAVGGLWALAGLAGAVGALCTGHVRTTGRERLVIVVGLLATALAICPTAMMFGLPGLTVGLVMAGFFAGPIDVGVLSLRQRRTEPGWLGRVLAVSMSLNMSGLPLGSALGGILITQSLQATFVVAALASVMSAFSAYALLPSLRRPAT